MADTTLELIEDTAAPVSPDAVEIRGRTGAHVVLALAAGAVAVAFTWRIGDGAPALWWLLVGVLAVVAVGNLGAAIQSRTPTLVADEHGVRVRQGRRWAGLPWDQIGSLHVEEAGSVGDSVLVIVPADGRDPVRVPHGAAARATATDLVAALDELWREHDRLAVAATVVTEAPAGVSEGAWDDAARTPEPEPERAPEPAPAPEPRLRERLAPEAEPTAEPVHAAARRVGPLSLVTSARRAVRAQVHRDGPATVGSSALKHEPVVLPEVSELRRTEGKVGLLIETVPAPRPEAAPSPATAVGAAPVEAYPTQPAPEPVIGPHIAAARNRLRVSVDALSDRTRIRPHVIESIEVDDFVPCGGDFYARGHLRSLCRTLGVDATALLETYDREYAHPPVTARRVFEAELATGPQAAIRSVSGGPRWSVLVGVVMALAIVWGAAQIVTERTGETATPQPQPQPPALMLPAEQSGPTGLELLGAPQANSLRLVASQRARVEVRDADGALVWSGTLREGGTHQLELTGPATVSSSVGKGVRMVFNGTRRGVVGTGARPGERTVAGRDR